MSYPGHASVRLAYYYPKTRCHCYNESMVLFCILLVWKNLHQAREIIKGSLLNAVSKTENMVMAMSAAYIRREKNKDRDRKWSNAATTVHAVWNKKKTRSSITYSHQLRQAFGLTTWFCAGWFHFHCKLCFRSLFACMTKFIAWNPRHLNKGISTGSRIFAPAAHESRFVRAPHHKTPLCYILAWWDVR